MCRVKAKYVKYVVSNHTFSRVCMCMLALDQRGKGGVKDGNWLSRAIVNYHHIFSRLSLSFYTLLLSIHVQFTLMER